MIKALRFTLITMALGGVALVSGCSGKPSDSEAKTAIDAVYRDSALRGDFCWAPASHATLTFPMNVRLSEQDRIGMGILDGLDRSGLVTVQRQVDPQLPLDTVLRIDLTDKGKAAHAWDPMRGFCVGTPTVRDVVVEPAWGHGHRAQGGVYGVTYLWTFDTPAWVERDKFIKVPGMASPRVNGMYVTRGTNGWGVIPNPWGR